MNTFFKTIPSIAYVLCGKRVFLYVRTILNLWFVLIVSELLHFEPLVEIKFIFKGINGHLKIKNRSDVAVLKETFLMEEYRWDEIDNPNIIVDLGAHIGDTSLYYHCIYPSAKIYVVEPDPVLFKRLCENVKGISQIVPIHAAISNETGTVQLNVTFKSTLSGSLMERKNPADEVIAVPSLTLSELFVQQHITKADLLKFDIEGAEKYLFSEYGADYYASAYIGELHCDLMGVTAEVFLENFKGFVVDLAAMDRSNRFNIKAIKR